MEEFTVNNSCESLASNPRKRLSAIESYLKLYKYLKRKKNCIPNLQK